MIDLFDQHACMGQAKVATTGGEQIALALDQNTHPHGHEGVLRCVTRFRRFGGNPAFAPLTFCRRRKSFEQPTLPTRQASPLIFGKSLFSLRATVPADH